MMFFSMCLTIAVMTAAIGLGMLAAPSRRRVADVHETCASCGFDAYHHRGRCPECGARLALSSIELARVMQSPVCERRLWRTRRARAAMNRRDALQGLACLAIALFVTAASWALTSPTLKIESWLPTSTLLARAESPEMSHEARARSIAELRARSDVGTLLSTQESRLARAIIDESIRSARSAHAAPAAPDVHRRRTAAFVDRAVTYNAREPHVQRDSPSQRASIERRDGPKPPALFTFDRGTTRQIELASSPRLPGDIRELDTVGQTPGLPSPAENSLTPKKDNSPFARPEFASVEEWLGDRSTDLSRGVRAPRLRSLNRSDIFTVDFNSSNAGIATGANSFSATNAWDRTAQTRRSPIASTTGAAAFRSQSLSSPISLQPARVSAGAQRIRPTRR